MTPPTERAEVALRQVGWILPEGLDATDEIELPAHGLYWTRHVDHDKCLPLYVIEEKPND